MRLLLFTSVESDSQRQYGRTSHLAGVRLLLFSSIGCVFTVCLRLSCALDLCTLPLCVCVCLSLCLCLCSVLCPLSSVLYPLSASPTSLPPGPLFLYLVTSVVIPLKLSLHDVVNVFYMTFYLRYKANSYTEVSALVYYAGSTEMKMLLGAATLGGVYAGTRSKL